MAEFTSTAQGNANTALGIIGTVGTAATVLPNLLGGVGLGGVNNARVVASSEDMPVTRYEMKMNTELANKDAEIALLKADKYTDEKMVEIVKDYETKIGALAAEVRTNKATQDGINAQQAVYNGTANATLACMQGQIQQLFGLTKLVVPNGSVCPGFGAVKVVPDTTTTTTGTTPTT